MKFFQTIRRVSFNHFVPDVILIFTSLYASLYIRLGWEEMWNFTSILNKYILLFFLVRIASFVTFGVYNIIWRYISLSDVLKLLRAIGVSSILLVSVTYLLDLGRLPRTVFLIDTGILTLGMVGIRILRRLTHERTPLSENEKEGKRTLIFGAGSNGRALASQIKSNRSLGFHIVGFIDDDLRKSGRQVSGITVLGGLKDLAEIMSAYRVTELFFAISRPSGEMLKQVIEICNSFRVKPRLIRNVIQDNQSGELRDIELSDLLNRPQRQLDPLPVRAMIEGKKVLITGAGGSIGSELAHQINALHPSQLLLLDHSELNLYQIDTELRSASLRSNLVVPLLVDIKEKAVLKRIFKDYTPDLVFHAAAYKHVHLVEANPFSSITNNIEGTRNLLELSQEFDIETFVMISTDKAVNPAGVMGATKRVCEMMVATTGRQTQKRYCAVRFGNVLGSSGSLIPLLKQQILNQKPITITHPEITRYFMLIPEAVALVLRAATVATPGDITLLKMGEPLRILDIAKSLIALMGRKEEEVPIVFTGLRPGEKLYEELYISGNEMNTEDPDILIVPHGDKAEPDLDLFNQVKRIVDLARNHDRDALYELSLLVKSKYSPPNIEGSDPHSNLLYLGAQKSQ